MWHVPKRAGFNEFREIIIVLCENEFDNKAWDGAKQERLASVLHQREITEGRFGRVSPSSIRTIISALKFMGFVTVTSVLARGRTSKRLHVTDIGRSFATSPNYIQVYRNQLTKLIITNPDMASFCRDIAVFPFVILIELIERLFLADFLIGLFLLTVVLF